MAAILIDAETKEQETKEESCPGPEDHEFKNVVIGEFCLCVKWQIVEVLSETEVKAININGIVITMTYVP